MGQELLACLMHRFASCANIVRDEFLVGTQMACQMVRQNERFAAVFARVGSLAGMRGQMASQFARCGEAHLAVLTMMRMYFGMNRLQN